MTGKTHALIGANAIWILPTFGLVGIAAIPLAFVGALAGLLPDIDAKEAEIHDQTYNVTKVFFIHKIFGHRRFFHSILAAVLLFLALQYLLPNTHPALAWIVLTGYLSHMFVDGFNTKGVCYLYPYDRPLYLFPDFLRSRCGGWADDLLFVVGIGGLSIFAYKFYPTMFQDARLLFLG